MNENLEHHLFNEIIEDFKNYFANENVEFGAKLKAGTIHFNFINVFKSKRLPPQEYLKAKAILGLHISNHEIIELLNIELLNREEL